MTTVILGGGFTGRRVAAALRERKRPVLVTTRDPADLADVAALGADVRRVDVDDPATLEDLSRAVPPGCRVLHSVPALRRGDEMKDPTPALLAALDHRPARIVYISTTGVYGETTEIDETTPAAPVTRRQVVRHEAEEHVRGGPWSSLVLRPAAIYGPGRGVHRAMKRGTFKLIGDGGNVVSRVHVDALAALALAALDADREGAFPVADDEPCSAREIAAFCAERLGLPMPPSTTPEGVPETLRVTRKVDARAVREALGVTLRYPSYRVGIPACIDAEG